MHIKPGHVQFIDRESVNRMQFGNIPIQKNFIIVANVITLLLV